MKQNPFKVGDRVAAYSGHDRFVARVTQITGDMVYIPNFVFFHWRQCLKIKITKRPRKTIWVNEYEDGCFIACSSEEKAIKVPCRESKSIRVAVPYREVKVKK